MTIFKEDIEPEWENIENKYKIMARCNRKYGELVFY